MLPKFIYGTAWKQEQTASLVELALKNGFQAIDTANQRKHYFEEGVGQGLLAAYNKNYITRDKLFLQTKFTFANAQDHRKPYDEQDPFQLQVEKSFLSSLVHLHTDYLDSYILHGPSGFSINAADLEVWQAMEKLYNENTVKMLGISNVNLEQLQTIYSQATVKPKFVQNRCFAARYWDKDIRDFCNSNNIHYQGFSLLTANLRELDNPIIQDITKRTKLSLAQIVFCFASQKNMIPLTGTTKSEHMLMDIESLNHSLSSKDINNIEQIAFF